MRDFYLTWKGPLNTRNAGRGISKYRNKKDDYIYIHVAGMFRIHVSKIHRHWTRQPPFDFINSIISIVA